MSIAVMAEVWKDAPVAGTELLMLLALADSANDDRECWPSQKHLAHKVRITKSQVIRILQSLERQDLIVIHQKKGKGRPGMESNLYTINPMTGSAHATTPSSAHATLNHHIESSIEPSKKEIAASPFVSMKNSIQKAFAWDKPTDNEWGQIGKAASQLLKADITPADVPLLFSYCKAQSGDKSFTPLFLTTKASDWKKNRPPVVVPDKPLETYHHDLDDGSPATPEQIEAAKATFAALVASKNANDKPIGVKAS